MSDKQDRSKKKKSIWRSLIDRRTRANKEEEARQEIISTSDSPKDTEKENPAKKTADSITIANDIGIQKNEINESKDIDYQEKNENTGNNILDEKVEVTKEISDSERKYISDLNTMIFPDDGNETDTADKIRINKADSGEYFNDISNEALFNQGRKFYLGEGIAIDIPKAVESFSKSAELGNVKASYVLYKIYYQNQASTEFAIQHLKKAADMNYLPAMYDYAIHLLYGDDVDKNTEKAIQLLDKCAKKGSQPAISKLFYLYRVGLGNKVDRKKAEEYRKLLEV